MNKQKTKIIAYDSNGHIVYTAVTRVNIFTQLLLDEVYYTNVKGYNKNCDICVCAFNAKHLNRILDLITTDTYYQSCRGCDNFKLCLSGEDKKPCKRGIIGYEG